MLWENMPISDNRLPSSPLCFSSVDDVDIGLANLRLFDLVSAKCCKSLTWPVSFDSIPERTFAEQLTYMDSVSSHILGSHSHPCHFTCNVAHLAHTVTTVTSLVMYHTCGSHSHRYHFTCNVPHLAHTVTATTSLVM